MTRGILKYSNKTWHYRLMIWTWCWSSYQKKVTLYGAQDKIPDNLCGYMRKLFLVTIPLAIPLFIWRKTPEFIQEHKDITRVVITSVITINTLVHFLNFIITTNSSLEPFPWYTAWVVIGILWGIILGIIGAILGIGALWNFIKCKTDIKVDKPSTMCLVEDYFEAKHDKICPRLEFVDDEKK